MSKTQSIGGSSLVEQVEIRVRGQMDRNWSDWFSSLPITHTESGETVLKGYIRDQAELRGILSRLADLGLQLIYVDTSSRVEEALKRSTHEEVVIER
jgi:hypothetical protein